MPSIENVFPAADSEGVPVGATIFVIFNEEVDSTTIERAFLVTGPDTDRWTGAGLQLFDRANTPEPEFFLDSPDYTGVVQGIFTVQKLDPSGSIITDATYSYGGSPAFRSKVIFTPNDVLTALTEYTVIVSGDELDTDDIKVGIASRTVFDTQLGSNTGDGEATFTGGYTGTITDEIVVEIVTAGDIGTATYRWYKTSDVLTIRTGTTSANEVLLDDSVYLTFGGSGFDSGDEFRVNLRPPQYMSGSSTWSFKTGSGSIQAVPSSTSTSVLGDVGAASVDTTPFEVVETNPPHLGSQVALHRNEIIVDFTDPVDPATISQDSVTVEVHPVRGAYTGNDTEDIGEVPKVLSLSNSNRRLTIKIQGFIVRHRSIRVQRVYKNTSGEILRIDTITVSGYVVRDKAFVIGDRPMKKHPISGNDVYDFGTFKFHSGGRKVATEIFQTTTTRVVDEVEMIGGFSDLGAGPNFNTFDWQYGTVDVSDLPQTTDTV